MLEWLKRHAWKACKRPKRFGGSNPPLSAKVSVTSCTTTSYADFSFKSAPNLRQKFLGCRTNVFNPL